MKGVEKKVKESRMVKNFPEKRDPGTGLLGGERGQMKQKVTKQNRKTTHTHTQGNHHRL